jgi:hypothetical protein
MRREMPQMERRTPHFYQFEHPDFALRMDRPTYEKELASLRRFGSWNTGDLFGFQPVGAESGRLGRNGGPG